MQTTTGSLSRPDAAYRVPFTVDRSRAPWFTLHNQGHEKLRGIRLTLLGSGQLFWRPVTTLEPRRAIAFTIQGDDIARDCVLLVRWFRPSNDEYLWRVSF